MSQSVENARLRARVQSFRRGMVVCKQIFRDKCRKYTALVSQCRTQHYKSKIESADQCELFGLVDGTLRVKPVPLLPSHSSAQDLTERFGAHFIDKIANLRRDLLNCPATTPAPGDIQSSSCSSAEFT